MDEWRTWDVGQGATGWAWQERQPILLEADQLDDERLHLTDRQREEYADLTYVASIPLLDSHGRPFAVLSASSKDANPIYDMDRHIELAEMVAVILQDVLQLGRS